jgi:hypothetical protein
MKTKTIALVGVITLFGTLALSFYSSIPMLALALAICGGISIGFLWQGHKTRQFWIATNLPPSESTPNAQFRIEGREFSVQELPSRFEFSIHIRNTQLLFGIGLIALASLASILTGKVKLFAFVDPDLNPELYWFYSLLCYLMLLLLLPIGEWVFECAVMRSPGITLANVHSQGKMIRYEFRGPQGSYHGGSALNFGGPGNDSLKVVLCNPANPDANRLSSGLLFHKIEWADSTAQ